MTRRQTGKYPVSWDALPPSIQQYPKRVRGNETLIEMPYTIEEIEAMMNYIQHPTYQNYQSTPSDIELPIAPRDQWIADAIHEIRSTGLAIDTTSHPVEQRLNAVQMAISLQVVNLWVFCLPEDVIAWNQLIDDFDLLINIVILPDLNPSIPWEPNSLYVYARTMDGERSIESMGRTIHGAMVEHQSYVLFDVDPSRRYDYVPALTAILTQRDWKPTIPWIPGWMMIREQLYRDTYTNLILEDWARMRPYCFDTLSEESEPIVRIRPINRLIQEVRDLSINERFRIILHVTGVDATQERAGLQWDSQPAMRIRDTYRPLAEYPSIKVFIGQGDDYLNKRFGDPNGTVRFAIVTDQLTVAETTWGEGAQVILYLTHP